MGLLSQRIEYSRNDNAPSTQTKQIGCYFRWERFLEVVGVKDRFLDDWSDAQRVYILFEFAASVRRNLFGKSSKKQLVGSTVSSTISNVCATFWANFWDNPSLDKTGKKALILANQLKKYIKEDPETRHQMELPLSVFRKIWRCQFTQKGKILAQLIVGALFFGLRSCEYTLVTGEERMTKLISVGDIRFFQDRQEVSKISCNKSLMKYCTSVSITFLNQKNGNKNITIIQHASHHELCPVKSWTSLIQRILFEENGNFETPVNTFKDDREKICTVKATEIAKHLKNFVNQIGQKALGFNGSRVGTHSIRSSFAMLLYLQGVHPSTIMIQG